MAEYEKWSQEIKEILEELYILELRRYIWRTESETLYIKEESRVPEEPLILRESIHTPSKLIGEVVEKMIMPDVYYLVYIYRYYKSYEFDPLYLCKYKRDCSKLLHLFFDYFVEDFFDKNTLARLYTGSGIVPTKYIIASFLEDLAKGIMERVEYEPRGMYYIIHPRDPLEQVLLYRNIAPDSTPPKPTYICSSLYDRIFSAPIDPNLAFVAYCTPLNNYIKLMSSADIFRYNKLINKITHKALYKIENNNELRKLWKKYVQNASIKQVIENIIRDEIEEANRIMRKYGIIRVTVTCQELDELRRKLGLPPED